jgi:omega-hydroxy-beta-dihydromenaquinone-9 sulfotransferase
MTTTKFIERRTSLGYTFGFISFIRLGNILRLARYLIDIHPRYTLRALSIGGASLGSLPLRLLETLCYGRRITRVRIEPDPLFIIGHWRSGTTHLHNLMSQDPAWSYVSMYQALAPDCSLIGHRWLKALLARIVPQKRPMDNMVWPMDAPQEEEIPLAKMSPYSFYTQFLFPRKTQDLFRRYVLLHDAPARAVAEFKRKYYRLLQIATLHSPGKRLVLKNPVNTARVRLLLELFPNAKFIHIHRSPYDVYTSTQNLHRKILAHTALQEIDASKADETVLALYEAMMQRFFAERHLIPKGNFAQVRFSDFERDPLGEVRRVYEALDLPGFASAEPAFRAYIDSQRAYRKNTFTLSGADRRRIEQRWAFAFAELGYSDVPANNP